MAMEKVINEGVDVLETAFWITVGAFVGNFALKVMPKEIAQYGDYALFVGGILAGSFIHNKYLSPVLYGMALSGALNIVSPYVNGVLTQFVH